MRLCRILLALRVCVRNHTSCDDHPLSKQGFQQRPLLCMLFGIIGLELSQVQELPLNGWEAFGVRKADQTEIRLGVVKRKQKRCGIAREPRSEEHTSELQSLMRSSYAVFCLKKKITP